MTSQPPCSPRKAAGGTHGAAPPANRATREPIATEPVKNAILIFCLNSAFLLPIFFLVAEASFQRGRGKAVCSLSAGLRGSGEPCWAGRRCHQPSLAGEVGRRGEGGLALPFQGAASLNSFGAAAPSSPLGQFLVCMHSEMPACLASLSTMLKLVFNLKVRAWLNRDRGHESDGEDMKSL